MPKPYSTDLRGRVIAAVEAGESRRAAATRFGVSPSATVKWTKRARLTGSIEPRPMGGRRPFALARHRVWVLSRLADKPDLTLRALVLELADQGVKISDYAVWNFLRREGVTFKKSLRAADLLGDRHHSRPARRMVPFVIHQHPDRSLANLR